MEKIALLINQKQIELDLLQHEMQEAFRYSGDMDYEYAALLYPIIAGLQREIAKLEALAQLPDPSPGEGFEAHINQFLAMPYQSMEIWMEMGYHRTPATICLLEIRKLKAKHTVSCTILFTENFQNFLDTINAANLLLRLGWHSSRQGNIFRYKVKLKHPEDVEVFCRFMSAIMMNGLIDLWKYAKNQYYRFR